MASRCLDVFALDAAAMVFWKLLNISVAVLLYRGTKLDEQYCDKVFVRRYELGIEIFTVIADLHVRITALELLSSGDETVE